jgi:hypothetical protein
MVVSRINPKTYVYYVTKKNFFDLCLSFLRFYYHRFAANLNVNISQAQSCSNSSLFIKYFKCIFLRRQKLFNGNNQL